MEIPFTEQVVEISYKEVCKIQSDQERCIFEIKPLFTDEDLVDPNLVDNSNASGSGSDSSSKFKKARKLGGRRR